MSRKICGKLVSNENQKIQKNKKKRVVIANKFASKRDKGAGALRGFALPEEIKDKIFGIVMFLCAVIVALSFFDLAGAVGKFFMQGGDFLMGKAIFAFPLMFLVAGLAFFTLKRNIRFKTNRAIIFLAIFILILGVVGILGALSAHPSFDSAERNGGWLGYLISLPFIKAFGFWVAEIIFFAVLTIGAVILWHLCRRKDAQGFLKRKEKKQIEEQEKKPSFIKKIFEQKFEVKEIEPIVAQDRVKAEQIKKEDEQKKEKEKPGSFFDKLRPNEMSSKSKENYKYPPIDLLEQDKGTPNSGDIKINSAIIKRTLQNFDIEVEMSEINVGPTVTQYTLKPAEGIKLSKITTLSSDISMALAAHPIRIEAPIPGRPLVGIEIPNSAKTFVRLRNLLEHPSFQNSVSPLSFALGRDVAGNPVFADLARMPHLLVAGSTGTGKTICLNSIILSLLFRNSPDTLRIIAIDPKRVEFSVYADLPHLLTPIIFDAQKTINALKWLITEMERRFNVLSEVGAKNILSYNDKIAKQVCKEGELKPSPLPYIVLIVDELADLMAARGREIEALVVRLAQMARAVGIHLMLATQRPSVEVITGLIKANITSRITFQVASQVDSRTILDMAGAEKLLGAGDLLFISSEVSKAKRMQGAFVSEKEIKKVVDFILKADKEQEKSETEKGDVVKDELADRAQEILDDSQAQIDITSENSGSGDDLLYEEAKKIVIQARKASASLLQRRLRLGYARAARLIDMLEENGVVGPGEGAKPREVYADNEEQDIGENIGKDIGGDIGESQNQGIDEEMSEDIAEETSKSEESSSPDNEEEKEDDGYIKL